MNTKEIPRNFSVQVYGNLIPYSQTISRARVRIFYKGLNRNSTYITEEFAEKLLSSLPYAPIKGIYDSTQQDFTSHGEERTEGHIYGVVPDNPRISWEIHKDKDGIEREYACADVLLYTSLYPEAMQIPGKSQSMELFPPSIHGMWQRLGNQQVFRYTDGSFLGLQALGDMAEPCFEGAEFYSLYTNLKELIDEIKGGKRMVNFKLSDSTKHDMLFSLINPSFTEERNWTILYGISEIHDDYALCFNYETQEFCRWYYQKDAETEEYILGENTKCYVLDVSETEYQALNLLKTANDNTFEKVHEVYTAASVKIEELTTELGTKVEEYGLKEQELVAKDLELEALNAKVEEFNAQIESFTSAQEVLTNTVAEKDVTINSLNETLTILQEFQLKVELERKEEVINRFALLLDEETINEYKTNLDKYTAEDLTKELAVKVFEKNPNLYSQQSGSDYIPLGGSQTETLTGAAKLIAKHKKR